MRLFGDQDLAASVGALASQVLNPVQVESCITQNTGTWPTGEPFTLTHKTSKIMFSASEVCQFNDINLAAVGAEATVQMRQASKFIPALCEMFPAGATVRFLETVGSLAIYELHWSE